MNSPVIWYGGKTILSSRILPILMRYPHRRYVEPFGGAASLMFHKTPVEIEVYNDLHRGLVNFFRVLQSAEMFPQLEAGVRYVLYSRQEYNEARASWEFEGDPVRKAVLFFIVSRMSFSGDFGHSWASNVTEAKAGMAAQCSKWLFGNGLLPAAHERFKRVLVENADWQRVLFRYDTPETLFYVDPPYVLSTRHGGERYQHELPDYRHQELVNGLLRIQGHAVVSGYPHSIYEQLTKAGWDRMEFPTTCRAVGSTRLTGGLGAGAKAAHPRTEVVWSSPLPKEKTDARP